MRYKIMTECLDPRYSTTRRVVSISTNADGPTSMEHGSSLHLPPNAKRKGEGGLRLQGHYKNGEHPAGSTEVAISNPLITVVTVVFNGAAHLERTILSVLNQTYDNVEYVIVDGGSTDDTLDIIRKYEHAIDYWVSEPDAGIYDAMNRGIALSTAPWLNFLNANDVFFCPQTLAEIAESYLHGQSDFIYSDAVYVTERHQRKREIVFKCDHEKMNINHQAAIYKRELHRKHGMYLVAPGVTISDYLFFSTIDKKCYRKADNIIAIYDATGISNGRRAIEQKFIVDYMINGMPKLKFLAYFLFYQWYRRIFK